MAAPESPASAALEALGFALFLRADDGSLRLHGQPPVWLTALWPYLTTTGDALPVSEASPFLENFLIDAEELWNGNGARRVSSGPWIEPNPSGEEVTLDATALRIDGAPALLLERLGKGFEEKKEMLQKARETTIAHQRLNSETQKKEILLSCIAEEMNGALANVVTALRLIEMEKHSPRAQQLLSLAMRATEEQQGLINKVLTVFASELEGLYDGKGVATIGTVLDRVKGHTKAAFAEKDVELVWPNELANATKLAIDQEQLVRVMTTLLECVLECAPVKSAVALDLKARPDEVLIDIQDEAALLPVSLGGSLFSKELTTSSAAPALQMRLQFCRVAMEKCGGGFTIETGVKSGNCFRLRIPKARAQEK
jgi:signal transduction histidine kinase